MSGVIGMGMCIILLNRPCMYASLLVHIIRFLVGTIKPGSDNTVDVTFLKRVVVYSKNLSKTTIIN